MSKRILLIGAADLTVLTLSIFVGIYIANSELNQVLGIGMRLSTHWMLLILIIITCLQSTGLYNPDYMFDMREAVARLITGFLITFILISILLTITEPGMRLRSALPSALALSFAGLLAVRFAAGHGSAAQYLKRRVLILGAGARAKRIESEVRRKRGHGGFLPIAYIPIHPDEHGVAPVNIIERPGNLSRFCELAGIDEIVVAADERRGTMPVDELLDCRMTGRLITSVTDFLEREAGQVELEGLYPSWLVFSQRSRRSSIHRWAKRSFDVVVSSLLLLLTLPVTAATAIAILMEGGGPIFYWQERTGLQGRPFNVVKFRSMRNDAEKDGVARWATKNDDRVTRIGRFIRKTRIDELPQIYNVLKGEMSFIGPRPERSSIVADLEAQIPFFKYRHVVKPGITGWAQVNYPYGASIEDARVKLKYDLYYVKNGSLLLDFLILMETVRVIVWPDGAR